MPHTYDYEYFINASKEALQYIADNSTVTARVTNANNHLTWREDVIEWRAIGSNPPTPPPIPPGHVTE